MTEQAVQSAEAVVKLTADVLETTNRQSQTITQLTQEMQAQTVQSAEVVVKLVAEVLEATNRQTQTVTQLIQEMQAQIAAEMLEATNRQTQIVTQFTQEMQAQMAAARRAANVNRWLTVIVLLLAGASAVLAYLTYQTLIAL